MYETQEEAQQKLASCLVLLRGSPVFIEEAIQKSNGVYLRYTSIRDKIAGVENIKNNEWEFRNLGHLLGYMNYTYGTKNYQESTYVVRSAVRNAHNTQGLSYRNIRLSRLRGDEAGGLPSMRPEWMNLCKDPCVADMLEGSYPSVSSFENLFENPYVISIAFDRDFSIFRHKIGPFYLEYKGKEIGYSEDLSSWKIGKRYNHLRESLEHKNVGIK